MPDLSIIWKNVDVDQHIKKTLEAVSNKQPSSLLDQIDYEQMKKRKYEARLAKKVLEMKQMPPNTPAYVKKILEMKEVPRTISIYVKSLTGKTYTIDVNPLDTIYEVQQKIYDHLGTPVDQQRLVFAGRSIHETPNKLLFETGCQQESTLHLVLRLRGGMMHVTSGMQVNGTGMYYSETDPDVVDMLKKTYPELIDLGLNANKDSVFLTVYHCKVNREVRIAYDKEACCVQPSDILFKVSHMLQVESYDSYLVNSKGLIIDCNDSIDIQLIDKLFIF